jgi:group I intron endonuclease
MSFHVFDLLYVDPSQVYEFLISMSKEGLVAGVYLWINRTNGKMYVGSSKNLYNRMKRYISNNAHGIIGLALLKHLLDSFVLIIFFVPNATSSLLLSLEQSVLDNCVCAYNTLPIAGSPVGSKHTDKAKAKMSAKKSKAVYLYVVHPHGLELASTGRRTSLLV